MKPFPTVLSCRIRRGGFYTRPILTAPIDPSALVEGGYETLPDGTFLQDS